MVDHQKVIDLLAETIANPVNNKKIKDIAVELNISESTVYKISSENSAEIHSLASKKRQKYHDTIRSVVYNALVERVKKSDRACELLLKIMGDLVERTESRVEYLTPDQKREKAQKLLNEILNKNKTDQKSMLPNQSEGNANQTDLNDVKRNDPK